jgi:16S rRNA processing protein RimM
VAAELHTDFPERFAERKQLFALAADGSRRSVNLQSCWPHLGHYVFKFEDVDSITLAEALVGSELQIRTEQRAALESGAAYLSDLIGCAVWASEGAVPTREVGIITEVQFGAGEAPLLAVRSGSRELSIPYAEQYLAGVDLPNKVIRLQLPEGMLQLDAPLTSEEKAQQSEGDRGKPRRRPKTGS